MTEKTEALRLANSTHLAYRVGWQREAAAELRRLHASCEDYAQHKQRQDQRVLELAERVLELKAQRDALLEALELAADFLEHSTEFRIGHPGFEGAQAKARAAIKAVKEEA